MTVCKVTRCLFYGCVMSQEMKNWHRPRFECLLEEGVDFLGVETIPAQVCARCLLCCMVGMLVVYNEWDHCSFGIVRCMS